MGAWSGFSEFSVRAAGDWSKSAPCHAAAIVTTQVGIAGHCAQKCRDDERCNFAAYCDSASDTACKREHKNACVLYSSCDTLAYNYGDPAIQKYHVYRKVDKDMATQRI